MSKMSDSQCPYIMYRMYSICIYALYHLYTHVVCGIFKVIHVWILITVSMRGEEQPIQRLTVYRCAGISMRGASQTSTLNVAKYLGHMISRNIDMYCTVQQINDSQQLYNFLTHRACSI